MNHGAQVRRGHIVYQGAVTQTAEVVTLQSPTLDISACCYYDDKTAISGRSRQQRYSRRMKNQVDTST
jgi:hypothetical protein